MVLTQTEVCNLLQVTSGTMGLVTGLLHGTGIRLLEKLRLRVEDVEFARRKIFVHEGKENKGRMTMLPENLLLPLRTHLNKVKAMQERDLDAGFGEIYVLATLTVQYPNAAKAWRWQYVFSSPVRSVDPHI